MDNVVRVKYAFRNNRTKNWSSFFFEDFDGSKTMEELVNSLFTTHNISIGFGGWNNKVGGFHQKHEIVKDKISEGMTLELFYGGEY
nr:hypothetical protein MarFTME_221 [Marseillevirus futianmevirus]